MSRMVSILTIQFQPQKDITAYELHEAYSKLAVDHFPAIQDRSQTVIHSDKWSQLPEELRRHFTVLKVEHKMELSEEEKQEEHKAWLRAKKDEVETIMMLQAVKGQIVPAPNWLNLPEAELKMLQKQMEIDYKKVLEEAAKNAAIFEKNWTGR